MAQSLYSKIIDNSLSNPKQISDLHCVKMTSTSNFSQMKLESDVTIVPQKRMLPMPSDEISSEKHLCICPLIESENVSASQVKIGCSECLCIAIESHRSELLRELLSFPNLVYRDMFWSHWPPALRKNRLMGAHEYFPVLHLNCPDDDRSIITCRHFGHEPIDEELLDPLLIEEFTRWRTDRILVSVPMIARWNSSADFDAEQILRDSGKFDYSEPQLYHLFGWALPYEENANGLNDYTIVVKHIPKMDFHYEPILCWSFEPRHSKSYIFNSQIIQSNFSDVVSVSGSGRFDMHRIKISKHFGRLSAMFEPFLSGSFKYFGSGSQFLEDLRNQLESGADLNFLMPKTEVMFETPWSNLPLEVQLTINTRRVPEARRSAQCSSVLYFLCHLTEFFVHAYEPEYALEYNDLVLFLLRHGLSVFLDCTSDLQIGRPKLMPFSFMTSTSLLYNLFSTTDKCLWPFQRAMAAQLLSLGYGRRELHAFELPPFDNNLVAMRIALKNGQLDSTGDSTSTRQNDVSHELQSLVQKFDSGPLTLQELSRIAIRRAVGGVDFARRVRSETITQRLPPALFDYVSNPTELMLSVDEVKRILPNLSIQ